METLPEFVFAGIPLIVIVFAIVEEIKAWGVEGKILRVVSLLVGFSMAFLVQLSSGLPADLTGWITLVLVGVVYGLSASGAYDFLDSRIRTVDNG